MGQAVSNILISICGEAEEEKRSNEQNLPISPIIQWVTSLRNGSIGESEEEKRSNEQNLQTSPIIQWVTSLRKGSMGQTLFYFLKSLCGEAEEEKRSNEQWVNSLNCLHFVLFSMALLAIKSNSCGNSKTTSNHISRLVSPPSLLSCIDASTANNNNVVKHRFKVDHSSILVVGNIDPSISSSSTGGTLLHEVFDDTLNDFSRIDSITDMALLHHELFVALSSNAPSTDMSSDQALFNEPFVDHSTDVASIDSSTDEALLHHELFVALSSYARSLDMSNDQALLNEISVDPSADVPTIGCSTDEALLPKLTATPSAVFRSIDQFKVTDSNIQVVENKVRSEDEYKEAKPREGAALPEVIERTIKHYSQVVEDKSQVHSPKKRRNHKGAKARKEAAVVTERKIKHYSSLQKILLVGEGDFSFSACLARAFGSASNIVATSLDFAEFLKANYKNAVSNICELKSRGAKVMHGVDATGMACNGFLNGSIYDRIIYNFPLVGFFPNESRKMQLERNSRLILMFLENAKKLISADGEIHISHKSNGFFLAWELPVLASNVGLRLIEEVPFNLNDYRGYNNKFGFGGDNNFNCNPSKTYKFGHKLKN